MAVLPQLGGLAEAQMRDSGGAAFQSAAAAGATGGKGGYYQQQFNNCAAVVSGAQSELTCNNGGGAAAVPSRKRGREAEHYYYGVSSPALLPPVPGMLKEEEVVLSPPDMVAAGMASRAHPGLTSRSGRPAIVATESSSSVADALAMELLRRQGMEVDALVQAECERLRAGLEHARRRQREALALAVARRLRESEAALEAARRRAAELEERVRQAAAESQAWCGLARSHEAAAAGVRATLEHLILRGGGAAPVEEEGFGESAEPAAAPSPSDALSSCFEAAAATTSPAGKWACKACGEGEASVLVLPCRHLCLCKACEPRLDACPVCLAVKNASIHVAPN